MGYDATLHVEAIRQPDAVWAAKKEAYEACARADIPIPRELEEFFNWGVPDPHGVVMELVSVDVMRNPGERRDKDDSAVVAAINEPGKIGYLLDPKKLPEGTLLRVYVDGG